MVIRLSLLALVACVLAAPAFAASSSSASIGPLTVRLFDLDPLDNVAPSITFNDSGVGFGNFDYARAYQSFPYAFATQERASVGWWTPNAAGASAGVAQAAAAISGPAVANGTTVSTSGSSADFYSPNDGDFAQYSAGAQAGAFDERATFTLSANTVVAISGAASVAGAGTSTYSFGDFAQVFASITIYGPGSNGSGGQSASDGIGFSIATDDDAPFSYTDSRSLGVSFVNLTGAVMTGYLSVEATVEGYSRAGPVPEPETWALMLAGLLAVGGMAGRRRDGCRCLASDAPKPGTAGLAPNGPIALLWPR